MASTPPATPAAERLERVMEECQLSVEQKQRLLAAFESCAESPQGELRLQLYPCNNDVTAIMNRHKYNPKLQLTVKGSKTFAKVLQHVKKKWISRDNHQFIFPDTFFLRPRDADAEVVKATTKWSEDPKLTIEDIFKKFGKKDLLQLEYGWATVNPNPPIHTNISIPTTLPPLLPFHGNDQIPLKTFGVKPPPLLEPAKFNSVTITEAPHETFSTDLFSMLGTSTVQPSVDHHPSTSTFVDPMQAPSETVSWSVFNQGDSLFGLGLNSNNSLLAEILPPASQQTAPPAKLPMQPLSLSILGSSILPAAPNAPNAPDNLQSTRLETMTFKEYKFHDGQKKRENKDLEGNTGRSKKQRTS